MKRALRFFAGIALAAMVAWIPTLYAQGLPGDPNQLTGRWKLEAFSNAFVELVADGEKLTGMVGNPLNSTSIADGVVSGNTLSFKTSSNNGDRTLTFAGIVDRDRITFIRRIEVRPGVNAGGPGLYGTGGPTTFGAVRESPRGAPVAAQPVPPPASNPFPGRWKVDGSDLLFNFVWDGSKMTGSVQDVRGSSELFDLSTSTNTVKFRFRDGEQLMTFVGIAQGNQVTFLRRIDGATGREAVTSTLTATRQPQ